MSTDNKDKSPNTSPELCSSCKTFYGSSAFGGLCSKCYKYPTHNLVPITKLLKK